MAQGNERAKKSIKNAVVSTVYYLAILGLSFFSRRIFFDYLGSEILGLNTTAKDLLSLLNITELGIGELSEDALAALADSCTDGGKKTVGAFRPIDRETALSIYRRANR